MYTCASPWPISGRFVSSTFGDFGSVIVVNYLFFQVKHTEFRNPRGPARESAFLWFVGTDEAILPKKRVVAQPHDPSPPHGARTSLFHIALHFSGVAGHRAVHPPTSLYRNLSGRHRGIALAWLPLQSLAVKKKTFFLCKFWAVKNF